MWPYFQLREGASNTYVNITQQIYSFDLESSVSGYRDRKGSLLCHAKIDRCDHRKNATYVVTPRALNN